MKTFRFVGVIAFVFSTMLYANSLVASALIKTKASAEHLAAFQKYIKNTATDEVTDIRQYSDIAAAAQPRDCPTCRISHDIMTTSFISKDSHDYLKKAFHAMPITKECPDCAKLANTRFKSPIYEAVEFKADDGTHLAIRKPFWGEDGAQSSIKAPTLEETKAQ